MSWAEVKKINSNFDVPLDELIKSQRILGASDAVIGVIKPTYFEFGWKVEETIGTFTPKVNGTIRILSEMYSSDIDDSGAGAEGVSGIIAIYNSSGTNVLTISKIVTPKYNPLNCDTDFNVSANETYTIKVKRNYLSMYNIGINYLKIGATVIDGSMMTYTTV